MSITLDKSSSSVVVLCSECPYWRGFGFDREHGWRVGAGHEKALHPDAKQQAQKALASAQRDTRHAAGSSHDDSPAEG
ncbi:hypothetical protein [Leifsonia aquatica]|uniref:hypothetical protein n=1 Tax=Leifsonia aquatica TaxID=144185 RepID=UPI003815F53A